MECVEGEDLMRTLRVADLEAKPGEKVSGFVHIIGAEFGIPVTLICGEKEGETVLISGGVHNAEYVGIQAAMQLADELDPKKIAGNIIVIRLMNRTGFEHRTMSLTYEDGKNLNRVFPGNPRQITMWICIAVTDLKVWYLMYTVQVQQLRK